MSDLTFALASVGQLYRERADAENACNKLMNPYGSSGVTTQQALRFAAAAA